MAAKKLPKMPPPFTVVPGDCREVLSRAKPNYFSCIVTSPPYNVGKKYGNDFEDSKPMDNYMVDMLDVFTSLYRVLRADGLFFLNIGNSTDSLHFFKAHQLAAQAVRAGFHPVDEVIWLKSATVHKPDGEQVSVGHFTPVQGKRLNPLFEYIFIFAKDKEKYVFNREKLYVPYADKSNAARYNKGKDGRCIGDVWYMPYATKGATKKKHHATEFPPELPKRCIKLAARGPVLDPMAGGGSVGVAAMRLRREVLLIDQNPEFAASAQARLEKLKASLLKKRQGAVEKQRSRGETIRKLGDGRDVTAA